MITLGRTLFCVICLLAGTAMRATAQASVALDLEAIEIRTLAPGVWMHTSYVTFPGGARVPSNGLVVRDGEELLLLDTAWGELQTAALLARLERDIRLPVRRALLTHAHGDRIAGADLLRARGIEVLATAHTRRLALESGLPLPSDTIAGLAEPGASQWLGGVELFFPGPGHAPDNIMVWIPSAGLLYGACAVRAASATTLGNLAHADRTEWTAALKRVLTHYVDATLVVPGHGSPGDRSLLHHTLSLLSSGKER